MSPKETSLVQFEALTSMLAMNSKWRKTDFNCKLVSKVTLNEILCTSILDAARYCVFPSLPHFHNCVSSISFLYWSCLFLLCEDICVGFFVRRISGLED